MNSDFSLYFSEILDINYSLVIIFTRMSVGLLDYDLPV